MMKTMLVGTSERVMNANISELGMEYLNGLSRMAEIACGPF